MPFVLAIPVVIEGVAVGGAWAYRGYQAYRAYRAAKALEAIITAQNNAKAEEEAAEKAKTDAQAKADAAAGCQGGNCDPDPNCDKWRQDVKKALYDVKQPKGIGGAGGGGKGLVQMMCEWMNGTLPAGADHDKAVEQALQRIQNNMAKLKNKKKFRCPSTDDLEEEAKPILEQANGRTNLPHTPRADFQQHCFEKSLAIAKRFMGGK